MKTNNVCYFSLFPVILLLIVLPSLSGCTSHGALANSGGSYTVTDLGSPNIGYPELAVSNNNNNVVAVAFADNSQSGTNLELWSSTSYSATYFDIPISDLTVMDVNDRGDVLFQGQQAMVLWSQSSGSNGNTISLTGLNGDTMDTFAGDINNSGIVPGGSEVSTGITRITEWKSYSPQASEIDCGFPSTYTFQTANVMNDAGDLAVWGMRKSTDGYVSRTCLFKNGKTTAVETLPGLPCTDPNGINSEDEIVGNMFASATGFGVDPHADHAFIWREGVNTDLGVLPGCRYSEVNNINEESEAVGTSYPAPIDTNSGPSQTRDARAFLWKNGSLIDLNTLLPTNSGWVLEVATQINDHGQIVGLGRYNGQEGHAFVLDPKDSE